MICFWEKWCVNDKIWEFIFYKFIVVDVFFFCIDEIKCGWFFKGFFLWIIIFFFLVLFLFLIVIYVIKCFFWVKLKGILLCFLFYCL